MGNRRREGGKRVLGELDVEIRGLELVDAAIKMVFAVSTKELAWLDRTVSLGRCSSGPSMLKTISRWHHHLSISQRNFPNGLAFYSNPIKYVNFFLGNQSLLFRVIRTS